MKEKFRHDVFSFVGAVMTLRKYNFFFLSAMIIFLCVSQLGCIAEEEAIYDEELGLQAISLEKGSLVGSFGLLTRGVGYVETGAFGDLLTGNDDFLLVERVWDSDAEVYHQTSQLCGADFHPVLDVQTVSVPEETFPLVPISTTETLVVDHEKGTYELTGHLQLLALRNLPDPFDTPFPDSAEEAENPPHDERIYDMDEDGHPGVTLLTEGLIIGEIYAIQRKRTDLAGVIVDPDHYMGTSDHLYEAMTLGASNPLLENPEPQQNGTDPSQSWFEEIRLAPGSDCETVLNSVETEELGPYRPF
jgi:hypothetical protein